MGQKFNPLTGEFNLVEPGTQGPAGEVSSTGASTADNFASFADETGDVIKDSGKKATDFAAAAHNHDAAYSAIDHNHDAAYAGISHTHAIADVTDLQTTLDGKETAQVFSDVGNQAGPTFALDFAGSTKRGIILSGSVALSLTNLQTGKMHMIQVWQDGTGGHVLSFADTIRWQDGVEPTWTTTADKVDLITLWYDGTSIFGSASLNY